MIGFNFLRSGCLPICQRVKPNMSVFFDDALKDIEICSPYVKIPVGRNWLEGWPDQVDQRLRDFAMQPVWPTEDQNYEMGRRLADILIDICPQAQNRQGYNEFPTDNNVSQFHLFCALELGFTDRLHERGYKSVVINAPVGNLTAETFLLFAPVLEKADYLGAHTYGANPDDVPPGQLMSIAPEFYFQRPLSWIAEAIKRNIRIPPVLRTEVGTYRPWKKVWNDVNVVEVSSEAVGDDIVWAASQLTGTYEGGMAVYCYNSNGDHKWDCYALDNEPGILQKIEEFNSQHPVGNILPASLGLPLLPGNDPNDYLSRYGEGFAHALWTMPSLIGEPLQAGVQIATQAEIPLGEDSYAFSHLRTTLGSLIWSKAQNRTYFLSNDGKAYVL